LGGMDTESTETPTQRARGEKPKRSDDGPIFVLRDLPVLSLVRGTRGNANSRDRHSEPCEEPKGFCVSAWVLLPRPRDQDDGVMGHGTNHIGKAFFKHAANKKALRNGRASGSRRGAGLLDLGGALELRGELLDAAGGVDHALLAGVGGMRIHGDVADDHEVILAVDLLGAGGLHRGLGQEFLACSDVEEADVVESGMAFGLHGKEVELISLGAPCNAARPC
jgi:hypothetical protein